MKERFIGSRNTNFDRITVTTQRVNKSMTVPCTDQHRIEYKINFHSHNCIPNNRDVSYPIMS